MYSEVKRVFYSVSEMSQMSNILKDDLRQLAHLPTFEALTLTDDGNILLTEQSIDHHHASVFGKQRPGNDALGPTWDWQLPRQKYMMIQELTKYLGVSKSTAYTLAHSSGFPIIHIGKHDYIPTAELKEWLNKRAKKFHNLR